MKLRNDDNYYVTSVKETQNIMKVMKMVNHSIEESKMREKSQGADLSLVTDH